MGTRVVNRDLISRSIICPEEGCNTRAQLHSTRVTRFADLGDGPGNDRSFLDIRYGVYFCPSCKRYFTQKLLEGSHGHGYSTFTKRVYDKATSIVIDERKTLVDTVRFMKHKYGVDVPMTTLSDWVRRERDRRTQHGE